jgi:HAD superfamily hydrolase (TIGR01509 family)
MRAALVDVDGTLVDSNYHHAIAWARALRDHGENARLAAIHRLVGMGGDELLEQLIGRTDDAIKTSWRTHFDALLPEVWAFDGAADLLRSLKAHGLTVVLATSSPEDLLDVLRAKVGAGDAVDAVVTASDVDAAKPHPDIFRAALEKVGAPAAEACVIGDSVWDVEAAHRAGICSYAVETGGFSRAELEDAGASGVFTDASELAANLPM